MGHVEAIREKLVVNVVGRLLQSNVMPPSCNLFFESIFFSTTGMLKKNEPNFGTVRLVLDAYSSNTRHLGCVFRDMESPK